MKISHLRTICPAPEGMRLVAVKVETGEPDLSGLRCATLTQRPLAVRRLDGDPALKEFV